MDIDAFLAAQLWLRRQPTGTWPLAGQSSQVSGGGVILAQAKCCLLLEDRPSAAPPPPRVSRSSSDTTNKRGAGSDSSPGSHNASGVKNDSPRAQQRPRPIWFSTRSAAAASAIETDSSTCHTRGNPGPSGGRSSEAASNRRGNPDEADTGRGSLFGGCLSRFQMDNSGTVRASMGEGQQQARGRSAATAAAAAAEEEEEDNGPVQLKREFDFDLAISRPRKEGRKGDDSGRAPVDEGGGALLLRIGGKVFQAEHTLIRSIAYPRGGGGSRGAGSTAGGNRNAANGRSDEGSDLSRSHGSGANGRGKSPAARGSGLPPPRPSPTAPVGTAAAAAAAAGTKRPLDASTADGAGVIADIGRGGSGSGPGGRPEVIGKRGRFEGRGGGVGGEAGGGDERATHAAAAAAPQVRRSEDGEDGAEEGMPFCGLFFPGVLLKFWLPQQEGNPAGTRAEAVARLQSVVSNMMTGLSPSARHDCPRGGDLGGIVAPELDAEIRSAVAEGKANGFRPRREAWDEFVYGSHVVLRQERASKLRHRSGGGHAGGPVGSRVCARCSGSVGIDPPVLANLSAIGLEDSRVEDEGPSDVGRARALTCLAGCFRKASLPSSVKLSAQRLLQHEAASAGRELEDVLERAFPLDLSQGTDTSTRVSVVSELEASLHRVQVTRKAALTLTLLPASEMLDELGDGA